MRSKDVQLNRRTVLQASGVYTLSVAGCLDLSSNDSSPSKDIGSDDTDSSPDEDSGGHLNGDGTHAHDEELDGPFQRADVSLITRDGHHFDPHVVWVEIGSTVSWTNDSGSHTTTAYHPEFDNPRRIPDDAVPWDSGLMSEAGKTFEHTFEVEGVYDYFCSPHEQRGMVGSVIVGAPDPHHQPGLVEPGDELPEEARNVLAALNERTNEALGHTHD